MSMPEWGDPETGIDYPRYTPDIIEFCLSDNYLGRTLYPRQATLLKIITLQTELFTPFDEMVIEEWVKSFEETGNNGICPDVMERITICQKEGRKWFREVISVIGRRGGKGHIGAILGAYVLLNYLNTPGGDPQGFYGVDRDKRMTAMVFAGKKEQAKVNQWRDLVQFIQGSRVFAPFISRSQGESMTIWAPYDSVRAARLMEDGIDTAMDLATFEIVPKESTQMAGRGVAGFLQMYDEMAWVVNAGSNRSAEEVYEAATPALDQFGLDGFIYEPSSPWQKTGKFYENYQRSLERIDVIDRTTGDPTGATTPKYPEVFMVQLTSWDPYEDWAKTRVGLCARPEIPSVTREVHAATTEEEKDAARARLYRGDPSKPETMRSYLPRYEFEERPAMDFLPLERPMQEYNEQMRRIEESNPETFRVERRSHFAAVMDAYLSEARIAEMWDEMLEMRIRGVHEIAYAAHIDTSQSGANTGFAIGHAVGPDDRGYHHVIFDHITHWSPGDFPENNFEIDYPHIQTVLEGHVDNFNLSELTFDQFQSTHIIQNLRRYLSSKPRIRMTNIHKRDATKSLNWDVAECFKTALNMGLIHAPYYEQGALELTFLQNINGRVDHPTTGPVQTKDVSDAMMHVVYSLIGAQMMAFIIDQLRATPLSGSVQGGFLPPVMPGSNPMGGSLPSGAEAGDPSLGLSGWGQRMNQARANSLGYNPARGDRFGGGQPFGRDRKR